MVTSFCSYMDFIMKAFTSYVLPVLTQDFNRTTEQQKQGRQGKRKGGKATLIIFVSMAVTTAHDYERALRGHAVRAT